MLEFLVRASVHYLYIIVINILKSTRWHILSLRGSPYVAVTKHMKNKGAIWFVLFKHLEVANNIDSRNTFDSILEPFFHRKSMNQLMWKSMLKKSWWSKKNDANADLHFDSFRNLFSWKIFFVETGACTRLIRFTHASRRGFAEKEGKQNKWNSVRKSSKNRSRKGKVH